MAEEDRDQVLDREALAVEARFGEGAATEVGLDGLDEAAVPGPRQRLFDRLGTSGCADDGAGRPAFAPERESRAEHADRAGGGRPGQASDVSIILDDRDGAVGGAEIDPDRPHDVSRKTERGGSPAAPSPDTSSPTAASTRVQPYRRFVTRASGARGRVVTRDCRGSEAPIGDASLVEEDWSLVRDLDGI